jgi:pilus assembly protein FimV
MMRKHLMSLLLLTVPGLAFALGLGNIELRSNLNQPFDARIRLLSPTADEIASLKVGLADAQAFERAGIDRLFILSHLHFEIVTNDRGPDYIHVTSKDPIREPYLDFLIEASWSNGRLYREYTVLLDPPLYDPNARHIVSGQQRIPAPATTTRAPITRPAPAPETRAGPAPARPETQAETAAPAAAAPAPAPAPARAAAPASEAAVESSGYGGGDYGPIVTGNTLWSIAKMVRPDDSVSIQQMMLALLRTNPDAFINGNINGLKRGYVLHMPDRQEITSVSKEDAFSESKAQIAQWQEIRGELATAAGERPEGAGGQGEATTTTPAVSKGGETELKIVTAKGTGAGQTEADAKQKLGKDLELANEQLQSLTSENVDLKDQISQSDAVIADLKRLINLKDDELATLQRQLQGMQAQAEAKAKAEAEAKAKAAAAKAKAQAEAAAKARQAATQVGSKKPAQAKAKPAPKVEEPASAGILDRVIAAVMDNLVMIAGALGAVLLAIAGLVMIRRRVALAGAGEEVSAGNLEEAGPADDAGMSAVMEATELPLGEQEAALPEVAEETEMPALGLPDETELNLESEAGEEPEPVGEETMDERTSMTDSSVPEWNEPPIAAAETAPGEDTVAEEGAPAEEVVGEATLTEGGLPEEEEEDPLAEVNVFLAYEHFDQAEEFVRDAIRRHPENLDYHSKLLEVFYAAGDKAKYEEEARVLHDLVNGKGSHWDMATVMWQEMSPSRELFAERPEGAEETDAEKTGGGVVDLTAELSGGEEVETAVDFDLGVEEEKPSSESTLDITATETGTSLSEEDEDILDVTAAVGLDAAGEIAAGEDVDEEHMLDITGGNESETHTGDTVEMAAGVGEESGNHTGDTVEMAPGGGEDLLDVTVHSDLESNGLDQDLLDLTSATSAGADSNELLDVASEEEAAEGSSEDNALDFEPGGLSMGGGEEAEEGGETAAAIENEDSLEFDIGVPEPEESAGEEGGGDANVLEFDSGGSTGEDEGGLEMDLSADEGDESELKIDDSGLEGDLSLDEESEEGGDFSLDLPQDETPASEDKGINLDFTAGGESGGSASSPEQTFELEIVEDESEDKPFPELDMESTVELSKPDLAQAGGESKEGEDATMFVARSSTAEEQSAEDEMASKLDLAKAYVELGDKESAKGILEEVIADGSEDQRKQARELLDQVS